MKFKYVLMMFYMPEYHTGDCSLLAEFDSPLDAYKEMKKLESDNDEDESRFYYVVVFEDV